MPFFVKTETIKKEYLIKKDIRSKVINEHIKWIQELKKQGIKVQSGFLVNELKIPGEGGLLIIEMKTYQEALQVIKKDPMIQNNLVEWKLNEWVNINY